VHRFTGTLTGNFGVLQEGMVAIVPTTAFQSEPLPIGKSSLLTIRLGPISARTTQSDHRFLQFAEIVKIALRTNASQGAKYGKPSQNSYAEWPEGKGQAPDSQDQDGCLAAVSR
jgi:hypothetical protein